MKGNLLLAFIALALALPTHAQEFRAQIISTVQGGTFWARSLNNSNLWGGFIRSPSGAETGYIGSSELAIHTGALAGGRSYVNSVGDGKWSAGSSFDATGTERAFLFWDNYLEDLSFFQPPGFGASSAVTVDSGGRVAGWIISTNGQKRTFRYDAGHFSVLPQVGDSSEPVAIWAGYVFGNATSNGVQRAFRWHISDPSPFYIPNLGGHSSAVYAAYALTLVGESETAKGETNAFLWRTSDYFPSNLGTLGGRNSKALGVNKFGHVVGQSDDSEGRRRAFFHRKGIMHDLNHLIDPRQPLILTTAFAINDNGHILAEGAYAGEAVHVLLTRDEPFNDPLRFESYATGLHKFSNFEITYIPSGPNGSNYIVQTSTNMIDWEEKPVWGPFSETSVYRQYEPTVLAPARYWRMKLVP